MSPSATISGGWELLTQEMRNAETKTMAGIEPAYQALQACA